MQYNKIGQFEYNDASNAYIPLLSYIIYEDKNKERFALLKFINKSGIRVNNFKIKIHQFDDEKEIQEDEILFTDLDVATHDAFVPFTKIMLNLNMKSFKIETLLINSRDVNSVCELKEDENVDNTTKVRKVKKRNKFLSRGVHASLLGLGILLAVGVGVYFGIASINTFKENLIEFEVDGFTISNKGVITNYSGSGKNLVIPSQLANIEVKEIGSSTFKNANIESITIEASSYTISNNAFDSCTSLKSINLGNVTEIGENAFLNCKNLTNVVFSSSPTLDSYCFANTGIKNFATSNKINVLQNAFSGCFLEEFNCPNASVSSYALGDSSKIETLIFSTTQESSINQLFTTSTTNAVRSITTGCSYFSDSFFKNLPNLTNVKFTFRGFKITDGCIDELKKLSSYKEVNGLELIGDCALALNINDSEYTLKTGFSNYSTNVFESLAYISNLTIDTGSSSFPVDILSGYYNTIRIEEGTKISNNNSTSSASIENLYIPTYNEALKNYFSTKLQINNLYIIGSGNIASGYLDGINVKNVIVSDSIKSIGARFLNNNANLTSATIPQYATLNGTIIGSNCTNLTKVEMPLNNNYSYYNESYKYTKELKVLGASQANVLSDKDDYNIVKLSVSKTNVDLSKLNKLSILSLSGLSGKNLSELNLNLSRLKTLIFDGISLNGFIDTNLSGINIMLINGASMSSTDVSNLNSINLYVDSLSASKNFSGYESKTVNTLVYNNNMPSLYSYNTRYGYVDYKTYKYTINYGGTTYDYQSVFLDEPLMVIEGSQGKTYQFSSSGFSQNSYITINEMNKYTYNIYTSETRTITYKVNDETYEQVLVNGKNTLKTFDIKGLVGWYTDSYYTNPVIDGKTITSDIVLYGKIVSNLIELGATKIESSGTYYINGNDFKIKVYGSGNYYIRDENYNSQSLKKDSYGLASEISISDKKLYSISLNAGDIIILEGNKTPEISVEATLKEKFVTSVETTSLYGSIDVSKVRNYNFLGLFTEDGLQITDSNGYIIANNIKFDENNILKLYAKYN